MKEYPEKLLGDRARDLDAHTWTVESYNAAVEHVYPFVQKHKDTTIIWEREMFELCRERVALGGYRLAHTISSIYA